MSSDNGTGVQVNQRVDLKSGLYCMAVVARSQQIGLSMDVLKQQFGHLETFSVDEMLRALQELDIKSKTVMLTESDLSQLPLPAILQMQDGAYAVLKSVADDHVVLHQFNQTEDAHIPLAELLSGQTIKVVLVGQQLDTQQETFGVKWFLNTLFKYKSIMRETLFASFFVQLFALVTPLFFMIIIDKVFSHNNLSTLNVLVFAMLVVAVFDVVLGGVRAYLLSHTTNRVDMELGMRLFKHMMALPLSYFESRRTGDTIARMREVEVIRNFLTGSSLTLLIDLFFVFVFIAVMFLFSTKLATIVVLVLPLFFLVSFVMTPLMRDKLEDKHEKIAENQSFLFETLSGIEAIKAGAVEPQQQTEWEKRLAAYAKCSFNSTTLSNLINQSVGLLSKLLTIALLFFGAKLVLTGDLSVGKLIAFNMLTARVVAPIQRLAQIWQEFTSTRVSLKRVADILAMPTEPMMLKDKTQVPALQGNIEFENVSFRYAEDKPFALKDIAFKVKAGEVIGIIGSTGSGKTTLIKLLQRLYVPTSGKVLMDGHNIVSMDGSWLRRQIGVVAQDFTLFNRSIRDNITLGDIDISDEQVVNTCELVGAHDIIVSLPDGYDTLLQERGLGLSTGQRQSIALARALVTEPAILILDEATSALDYESEQKFQANFRNITKNRTTFVVAHRLSTVRYADRILTIENGELIENDTPDNLLEQKGRFASLNAIHHNVWAAKGETV